MRILHISDLHIKKQLGPRDAAVLTRLYDFLKANAKDRQFDHIAITGDLRDAKEPTQAPGVDEVVAVLEEIASAANISEKCRIHIVPGNHDRTNGVTNEQKMSKVKDRYDPPNGIFTDTEEMHNCFREFFLPLCEKFYGSANPWQTDEDSFHTMHIDGDDAFIYLNSCIVSIDRKFDNDLLLGVNFYVRPLIEMTKDAKRVFILAHHPIQNLATAEEQCLATLIKPHSGRQAFYWLCGDAHKDHATEGKDYIRLRQVGTVMGSSKGNETTPEFAIYDVPEKKRRLFRFVPHLNCTPTTTHKGGWKRVFENRLSEE